MTPGSSFLAPTGAQEVTLCVRLSVHDICALSTLSKRAILRLVQYLILVKIPGEDLEAQTSP